MEGEERKLIEKEKYVYVYIIYCVRGSQDYTDSMIC